LDEALKCYSNSLEADPDNAVVYANRAMVFLKQERLERAEEDCSRSILIDGSYVKARYRRGLVRFKRGKYSDVSESVSLLRFFRNVDSI
jgi:tetratricopeptide (TPR) repeat protein